MKVLQVSKKYFPDDYSGVPMTMNSLLSSAIFSDVEFQIFTLSNNPYPNQPTVQKGHLIWQSKQQIEVASTGMSIPGLFKFNELAKTADIIHYHHPWPFQDMMHFLCNVNSRTVVTYHADVEEYFLYPVYKNLMFRFLNSVDCIVATSPNYATSSKILRQFKHKLKIIPIGITAKRETPSSERLSYWRKTIGQNFVLFLGFYREYKNLQALIDAAKLCGLKIVLAGKDIAKLPGKLPSNVIAVGSINDCDKEALLELCMSLVLPSNKRAEAFGLVLLEAMRAKKPIITCEVGSGTSFVNQKNKTGLIVSPNSPQELASAMEALAQDKDVARTFGIEGNRRFLELFEEKKMASAYRHLYINLLQGQL